MPTILAGRVQVPDSQCAMRWHELLLAARILRDAKYLISEEQYYLAEQSLELLAGNLSTVSMEPELKETKEKMARQDVMGGVNQLGELESRLLSQLIGEVYKCECQAKAVPRG